MEEHDKDRGLYNKFVVSRTDGSSNAGGRHADCEHFVLDITHDPFAGIALLAYAEACALEYPKLAADLREKVRLMSGLTYHHCLFVQYSDIPNRFLLPAGIKQEEFEDEIGKTITWGANNRTLVCQDTFLDAVKECNISNEAWEKVASEIVAFCDVPTTFIDMEN
jgi:hypothetical protein